jgi:hypothetical protein
LVFDPVSLRKQGYIARIPQVLRERWSTVTDHYVVLVEQAAMVGAVFHDPMLFKDRDLYWYEDNSAVLASLVKGDSRNAEVDAATATVHMALAFLKTRAWFEYIQSASNWSDSASRLLDKDPWSAQQGFALSWMDIPSWPWSCPPDERASHVCQALAHI